MRLGVLGGLLVAAAALARVPALAAATEPSSSLDQRVRAVLPTAEDDRWLQIPWRTSIPAALAEARKEKKPVLLWVMNGNPLGCA